MSNIEITQGEPRTIDHRFLENGRPFNLTGASVYFRLFADPDDADGGAAVLTHSWVAGVESGLSLTDPDTGVVATAAQGLLHNRITAAESNALTRKLPYYYEVKLTDTAGVTRTYDAGTLLFVASPAVVTRFSGITRRQLRRDILGQLGDVMILRATAAGSNTTLVDEVNLVGEPGAYKGREALLTGGTARNLGEIRYVAGSSRDTRSIGFDVALPAATAIGDECEMVNFRGSGYRIQHVHDAINTAIRDAREGALTALGYADVAFDGDLRTLAIPEGFATIERVQYKDTSGGWHDIQRGRGPHAWGWAVDSAGRVVTIGGSEVSRLDTRTVRIWGLSIPGELDDDDDRTPISGEWLRAQTMYALARARFLRMPTPEAERQIAVLGQEARMLRPLTVSRRGPFSVPV